jgi:hypothetical protein
MSETSDEGTYAGEVDDPGFVPDGGNHPAESTYLGEVDNPAFLGGQAAHAADVAAHDVPIEHDELGDAIAGGLVGGGIGHILGDTAIEIIGGEGTVAAIDIAAHHLSNQGGEPTYVGEADDPQFVGSSDKGTDEVVRDAGAHKPGGAGVENTYLGEADDSQFVGGTENASKDTYVGEADDPQFVDGSSALLPTADDDSVPPGDIGWIAADGGGQG